MYSRCRNIALLNSKTSTTLGRRFKLLNSNAYSNIERQLDDYKVLYDMSMSEKIDEIKPKLSELEEKVEDIEYSSNHDIQS